MSHSAVPGADGQHEEAWDKFMPAALHKHDYAASEEWQNKHLYMDFARMAAATKEPMGTATGAPERPLLLLPVYTKAPIARFQASTSTPDLLVVELAAPDTDRKGGMTL